MRQGKVYIDHVLTGLIREDEEGYHFQYEIVYLQSKNARAVSRTLPLRKQTYSSETLHAFFDGLIPEGWLLDIARTNWKISTRDRMGLLLTLCRDCIGNVSVIEDENL